MGRGEGLLEGVEKVQLWGKKKESDFFEIGFFEDGTNIEHRVPSIEQMSSAGRVNKRRFSAAALYLSR